MGCALQMWTSHIQDGSCSVLPPHRALCTCTLTDIAKSVPDLSLGGRIISEPALEVLRSSVFLLLSHVSGSGMSTTGSGSSSEAGGSSIDSSRCGGVGVCVSERQAITGAHNLDGSDVGDSVKVFFPASRQQLQLKVVVKNTELDYAVLSATGDMLFSTYPPLYGGPSSSLVGKQLAMCAFQLGVRDELSQWSSSSVGVMPATGVKLSRHEHHLLYTADTWPGDSGGALVVYSGELVGLHMCGVNALKEKFQQMRSLDERVTAVEESLESAARSVASGCIALLANAFADDIVRST